MPLKIGDKVRFKDSDDKSLYIIVKKKASNIGEDEIGEIIAKTNILNFKAHIDKCVLGDFDYVILEVLPSPFPKFANELNFKYVYQNQIILYL